MQIDKKKSSFIKLTPMVLVENASLQLYLFTTFNYDYSHFTVYTITTHGYRSNSKSAIK